MNILTPLKNGKSVHCGPLPIAPRDARRDLSSSKKSALRKIPVSVLRNRVHPAKSMTDTAHRREVERHIKIQSERLREASKISTSPVIGRLYRAVKTGLSKARSYQTCGKVVSVRACGGCGEPRPGTSIQPTNVLMMRCDMECCGHCGRYKANILSHKLRAKLALMPLFDGFNLTMITVTEHSSPCDSTEYTVERLGERVQALRRGTRALWDPKRHLGEELPGRLKLGARVSTGMFERIELSDNGALHAHIIFYGPYRDKDQVESILKRAWPAAGFVDFEHIANTADLHVYQDSYGTPDERLSDAERRINSAVREVAKYAVKAASPLDENHLAGGKRVKIDPALAAKYELATYCQRLVEWRGTLRGSKEDEAALEVQAEAEVQTAQQSIERDGEIVCECCGVVGEWHWREMAMEKYVQSCHARRKKALLYSRWIPPPEETSESSRHGPPASA